MMADAQGYSGFLGSLASTLIDQEARRPGAFRARFAPRLSYVADALDLPLHARITLAVGDPGTDADLDPRVPSVPFAAIIRGAWLPSWQLPTAQATWLLGRSPGAVHQSAQGVSPDPTAVLDFLFQGAAFAPENGHAQGRLGIPPRLLVGVALGDPFLGKRARGLRYQAVVRLLQAVTMRDKWAIERRMAHVGDPASVAAETRPIAPPGPPLTATEVLATLAVIPVLNASTRTHALLSLLPRMGRLEAYALARLLTGQGATGLERQPTALAASLAAALGAPGEAEMVGRAIARVGPFEAARIASREGTAGLRQVRLRAGFPVRPAEPIETTATAKATAPPAPPRWVEADPPGVRLQLHLTPPLASWGSPARAPDHATPQVHAFTRHGHDWIDRLPGLELSARALRSPHAIVDGRLVGRVHRRGGPWSAPVAPRYATVYELMHAIAGGLALPLELAYIAHDLLLLDGRDLTGMPWRVRREALASWIAPARGTYLPVRLELSEGELAPTAPALSRAIQARLSPPLPPPPGPRAQGASTAPCSVVVKDPAAPYRIASIDPSWTRHRRAIRTRLVVLEGLLPAGAPEVVDRRAVPLLAGLVLGAAARDGSFVEVGTVDAGDPRTLPAALRTEIASALAGRQLITGRTRLRAPEPGGQGAVRALEIIPQLIVEVTHTSTTRDLASKRLRLNGVRIRHLARPVAGDLLTAITPADQLDSGALEGQYS